MPAGRSQLLAVWERGQVCPMSLSLDRVPPGVWVYRAHSYARELLTLSQARDNGPGPFLTCLSSDACPAAPTAYGK